MNFKKEYECILEEINDIDENIEMLKNKRSKLDKKRKDILASHCRHRNEEEGKCSYDGNPLNKEGYCCSDCVAGGYCHISL